MTSDPVGDEGPIAALGIVSAPSLRGRHRRSAIRDTWPLFDNVIAFIVRFVVRCEGLNASSRTAILHEPRTVCAGSVSARETRLRGPILALAWWLRHALSHWPDVTFICKADSDTWLVLPDIAHHLESVVAHV